MSFNGKKIALIFSLLIVPEYSFALDPVSIFYAAKAGYETVRGFVGAVDEVSEGLSSVQELYEEVNGEVEIPDEGRRLIEEIRDIGDLARDIGYTAAEVDLLLKDRKENAENFSNIVRSVTRAIRTSKKISKIFDTLKKKANKAQIESLEIQKKQIQAQYKQLEILHEMSLSDIKKELKKSKERKDQSENLKSELRDKGVKSFKNTGVLSFPKETLVLEKAIDIGKKVSKSLFGFIVLVFFIRVIFYQLSFAGTGQYGNLAKDVIVCALLLAMFPEIVRLTIQSSEKLADDLGSGILQAINPKEMTLSEVSKLMGSMKISWEWVFTWIKYIFFVFVSFIVNFGLSFLIVIFPIVIFASEMLGFSIAWSVFFGSFLTLSLWRVFWNIIGLLASTLWQSEIKNFGDIISSILFTVLQFFAPFIVSGIFRGQSLSSAVSGSVYKFASGAVSIVGATRFGGRVLGSSMRGASSAGGLAMKGASAIANTKNGMSLGYKMRRSKPYQGYRRMVRGVGRFADKATLKMGRKPHHPGSFKGVI